MKCFYLSVILNLVSCEAALRIIGGRDALRNEFPFVIRLERKVVTKSGSDNVTAYYVMFCSGAAVNSEWILTAAHCYVSDNEIYARYNSYFPNDMGQVSSIKEVFIHPRYQHHLFTTQVDIALFRSQNIAVSQYAKISGVDHKTLVGHEVTILGFGITNASMSEKPAQVVKGIIIYCPEKEQKYAYSSDTMMCVGSSCSVKATLCPGDSGGPVIHASGIVAVSARSLNRCKDITDVKLIPGSSAGVIAMASHVLDWISNIILNKATQ